MFIYKPDYVIAAEKRIAAILAELEKETGCNVRGIGIDSYEVTQIDSQRKELQMQVSIEIERPPGHFWNT